MRTNTFHTTILVFIVSIVVHMLSGCNRIGTAIPDPLERGLLTGECLKSDNLKTSLRIESNSFQFAFGLDMDSSTEELPEGAVYRRIPPSVAYMAFGNNGKVVQDEFDRIFNDFYHNQSVYSGLIFATTVFYDEGMTLTANKAFAGHAAGENLIPYCVENEQGIYSRKSVYLPLNEGVSYKYMIPYDTLTPYLAFPCGDFKIVDEDVTFTLKIPVKVALYLTWLNNRLSNPNAEMPLQEMVLQGVFNIGKGLR